MWTWDIVRNWNILGYLTFGIRDLIRLDFNIDLPGLVNLYITMENHHAHGKIHEISTGPYFSIAILT